jgi:uncharacterized membrane protein (UPF0127 family)
VGRPHFLEPLLKGPYTDAYAVVVERLGTPIATTVEGAFDSATRNRGLLGRSIMPEGLAMIIAPSNAIHTWFMRFPIDIVFARRDGRVVKIRQHVKPWRIAVSWRAFAAIELAAGTADRHKLIPGDRLTIVSASH